MKKNRNLAICFSLLLLLILFCLPGTGKEAKAASGKYTLGKKVSSTLPSYGETDTYLFTVSKDTDVHVEFSSDGRARLDMDRKGTGYYGVYSGYCTSFSEDTYLPAGSYSIKIDSSFRSSGKYRFKVSAKKGSVSLTKKSVKLAEPSEPVYVGFTYSCSYDYAKKNLRVTSSAEKIAKATIALENDGTGTIKLLPGNQIGIAKVKLILKGKNTKTLTVTAPETNYYVATGKSVTLTKPVGVSSKSLKWKSSKPSVASVSSSGTVKTKANGRAVITAKKGSQTFSYHVIVTDFVKLGKTVYKDLKENVMNPASLKIYNVYYGYDKNIITDSNIPVIFIDYGCTNKYGAMAREKIIAYYNDVHEVETKSVSSYKNITKRKTMDPAKIKK